MAQTLRVEIKDPAVVDFVRGKVESGEYGSEEEVVAGGILTLREEDADFERWLVLESRRSYDDYHADPESAFTVKQAQEYLEEQRKKRAHVPE